jgi:hypothetical protein
MGGNLEWLVAASLKLKTCRIRYRQVFKLAATYTDRYLLPVMLNRLEYGQLSCW